MRKESKYNDFFGWDEFLKIKSDPPKIKWVGVKLLKGGVLREGCQIFSKKGTEIGKITSGCFSPILKKGIG